MARYEMVEEGHAKFWEIERAGATVTVTFGRIGTAGQSKPRTHPSAAEAEKAEQQLIAEKTKKGYRLVGAASDAKKKSAPPAKIAMKKPSKEAAPKQTERAPAATKAKPGATQKKGDAPPPKGGARLDGSLNRFVNKSGEQVDLRVASGDFPTSVRLTSSLSTGGGDALRWSPKGDRVALNKSILVVDGKAPVDHPTKIHADSFAWAPDGSCLYLAAYTTDEGGRIVTVDPEGNELSRFKIAGAPRAIDVNPKDGTLVISVSDWGDGRKDLKDVGISIFDPSGKKKRVLSKYGVSRGVLRIDPSGTLISYEFGFHVTVTDLEGKTLLGGPFEGPRNISHAWIGPRELLAYLSSSDDDAAKIPDGFYRIRFGAKGAEKPEFIGDFELSGFKSVDVSWDGRLIGVARNGPSVIDIYDVATGKPLRHLWLPKGNSETYFAFAPDGRVSGIVNWQHVVHMFGQAPRFAVIARSAPSEAAPRKSSEKYFDTDEAAQREAQKQIAALESKGFSLASIDAPAIEEEIERRDLLRRIGASSLASGVRHALVPTAASSSNAAISARFRGAPSLAKGETHPACPSCKKPMTCLVEIDLESLPAASELRGEGLLQVFWCENKKPHCEVVTSAWETGEGGSKLVRLLAKASRKTGAGGREVSAWTEALDLPDDSGDDVKRACGVELRKAVKTLKIETDEWPGAISGAKIGGYPSWVQEAEFPTCPVCKEDMNELVLQLAASDTVADMHWGDAGTAYVMRCPKHVDQLELFSQSS